MSEVLFSAITPTLAPKVNIFVKSSKLLATESEPIASLTLSPRTSVVAADHPKTLVTLFLILSSTLVSFAVSAMLSNPSLDSAVVLSATTELLEVVLSEVILTFFPVKAPFTFTVAALSYKVTLTAVLAIEVLGAATMALVSIALATELLIAKLPVSVVNLKFCPISTLALLLPLAISTAAVIGELDSVSSVSFVSFVSAVASVILFKAPACISVVATADISALPFEEIRVPSTLSVAALSMLT